MYYIDQMIFSETWELDLSYQKWFYEWLSL